MTMVSTGPISLGGNATTGGLNQSVNIELGRAATATINMNESEVRTLAGVPSGAISMSNFYGKANRAVLSFTFGSSTPNASLNVASISGYIAGKSDITITVNSGVYLYATSTGNAGLALTGGTSGDTITVVNNGFIMGMGGTGGTGGGSPTAGAAGGVALSLGYPVTVNNTNASAYIGGGGGGAGGPRSGAGGGGGGSPGGAGADGGVAQIWDPCGFWDYFGAGGGGGRAFPGTGGAGGTRNSLAGKGGTAGGGGGYFMNNTGGGGAGGSANNAGGGATFGVSGGGGGWGASGAATVSRAGGGGGRAVALNGHSVTWVSSNTTRVYGSVS